MTEIIPIEMSNYRICMFCFPSPSWHLLTWDRRWTRLVHGSQPFRGFYLPARRESRRRVVFCSRRVSIHGRRGSDRHARSIKRVTVVTSYALFTLLHTEFPRKPTGVLKDHLTIEADNRLGCYLPIPEPEKPPDPNTPAPAERPKLPDDVVDAPLVRIYNFLRKYCPLIICETENARRNDVNVIPIGDPLVPGMFFRPHDGCTSPIVFSRPQAEHLRSLGWGEFLKVEMSRDRKALSVSYWM